MNVRDYTCHLCGKSFVRPDALKKHLTCFHENVKAFFCNICSRTFKGHLPQHMRVVSSTNFDFDLLSSNHLSIFLKHQNIKSHGCANCGATFSQKSQLIVHQRIHSGERPYRCQVNFFKFLLTFNLKPKLVSFKLIKCVLYLRVGLLASLCPFECVKIAHSQAYGRKTISLLGVWKW